jgi:hypothetical protein
MKGSQMFTKPKITRKEQHFLDTYMARVNRVWAEWFATRGTYGALSMKQREEILALLRAKLHKINCKINS